MSRPCVSQPEFLGLSECLISRPGPRRGDHGETQEHGPWPLRPPEVAPGGGGGPRGPGGATAAPHFAPCEWKPRSAAPRPPPTPAPTRCRALLQDGGEAGRARGAGCGGRLAAATVLGADADRPAPSRSPRSCKSSPSRRSSKPGPPGEASSGTARRPAPPAPPPSPPPRSALATPTLASARTPAQAQSVVLLQTRGVKPIVAGATAAHGRLQRAECNLRTV